MVPQISFHMSNTYYEVTPNKTQEVTTLQITYTSYISKHKLEKVLLQKTYTIFWVNIILTEINFISHFHILIPSLLVDRSHTRWQFSSLKYQLKTDIINQIFL